eukprot:1158847-Pelagomonas_calceolata.AAC.2
MLLQRSGVKGPGGWSDTEMQPLNLEEIQHVGCQQGCWQSICCLQSTVLVIMSQGGAVSLSWVI